MQVSAVGSDALKDIIERVTSDSLGLHGHAWLDPPKGLSSVHFTFCPLRCGPQGPRGPPGKGWTDADVCVWKSSSERRASGRAAVCIAFWQNKCCMRCGEVSQWAWSRCCSSATALERRPLCIRPPQPNARARTALTHTHTLMIMDLGWMGSQILMDQKTAAHWDGFSCWSGQRMLNTH